MSSISFTVPLTPPSVNHYVKHTRSGRHYKTDEASAFKAAVAIYAGGLLVQAKEFRVVIRVTLAKKERGDIDNFPKLVLDGMADCGVFRNIKGERVADSYVRSMRVEVDCHSRPDTGRTHIIVEVLR